eukprot:gene23004-1396_t
MAYDPYLNMSQPHGYASTSWNYASPISASQVDISYDPMSYTPVVLNGSPPRAYVNKTLNLLTGGISPPRHTSSSSFSPRRSYGSPVKPAASHVAYDIVQNI